jgi:hypothetical protein
MTSMRFRLGLLPMSAALLVFGCGRTESLIELADEVAEGDTFSLEDTATTLIADEESSSGTDDLTTDWGDDVLDTWGEATDIDTFDTVDTFDTSTDVDTLDSSTTDPDTSSTTDPDTSSTTDPDTSTTTTTDTSTTSTTDPGPTCGDAVQCLVDCGNFSNACTTPCTQDLPADDQTAFFDLQICAIQSCFFLGLCDLGDFNAPECVQCRLDVNGDPANFGCSDEGMVCGV